MWVVWQLAPQQLGVAHSQPFRSGAVVLQFEYPVLHVYWQVVPLHPVLVALPPSHTAPHIEQLSTVLSGPQLSPASAASLIPLSCTSVVTTSLGASSWLVSLPES